MVLHHDCRINTLRLELPYIKETVELESGCIMESIDIYRIHDNCFYRDLEWYITTNDNVLHFTDLTKEGTVYIGYKTIWGVDC